MLPTKDHARTKLKRFESAIWSVLAEAWADYETSYREVRANHRPGTQATVIHELIAKL